MGAQRVSIAVAHKLALRKHAADNPGVRRSALTEWFNEQFHYRASRSTVTKILSDKYFQPEKVTLDTRRRRTTRQQNWPEVERGLALWVAQRQAAGREVTAAALRFVARHLFARFYPDQPMPVFSQGWLHAFRARHGIKAIRHLDGQADNVDAPTAQALLAEAQVAAEAVELARARPRSQAPATGPPPGTPPGPSLAFSMQELPMPLQSQAGRTGLSSHSGQAAPSHAPEEQRQQHQHEPQQQQQHQHEPQQQQQQQQQQHQHEPQQQQQQQQQQHQQQQQQQRQQQEVAQPCLPPDPALAEVKQRQAPRPPSNEELLDMVRQVRVFWQCNETPESETFLRLCNQMENRVWAIKERHERQAAQAAQAAQGGLAGWLQHA